MPADCALGRAARLGMAFKGSGVGGKQESSPQGKKGESSQAN